MRTWIDRLAWKILWLGTVPYDQMGRLGLICNECNKSTTICKCYKEEKK